MSNTIGFTNFRRFTNFPEIDLGDITILVGGNNAGKSTLVKAMLLMRDFLKSRINSNDITSYNCGLFSPKFSFDTEHVNVGDFYRAFCRQSPAKEDTISFKMRIDKFRFVVELRGERKPGVIPQVTMIAISDEESDIHFTFDFSKGEMTVHFEYDREALNNDAQILHEHMLQLNALKEKLSKSRDLNEISILKMEIEQEEKIINSSNLDSKISEYEEVTIPMFFFRYYSIGEMLLPELINGFTEYAETGTTGNKRSAFYKKEEANKNFLRGKKLEISKVSADLEEFLYTQDIEYIYAHSVAQKLFYADCIESLSSDYTKRTIHEFYDAHITDEDKEFFIIQEWLENFGIGNSIEVIPYSGDNYRVIIYDKENPHGIDLADKGMGSIQLVVLLLRIATFAHKYKTEDLTILLEEPEQNLHPAIQSKLADMVYEVNEEFGIRFIIETHSEYLIRRTQVLVAGFNHDDETTLNRNNPFAVYFLNKNPEEKPIKMTYKLSGAFNEKFGEGFFDEASKWDMMIIRKEFEQSKKKKDN